MLNIATPKRILETGKYLDTDYLILKNDIGYRCGYSYVRPHHPWYNIDEYDLEVEVHGGITFSEIDTLSEVRWLGFDCAHGGDAADQSLVDYELPSCRFGVVRTTEYVRKECESLILQIKRLEFDYLHSVDCSSNR